MRAALVLAGALMITWGGWLLWPNLQPATSVATWFLGGPLLHDLLLAPAVGVLGAVLAATVRPRWRAPLAAGLVVSAILVLLALPGLLRPSAEEPNPGLADRDLRPGLAAALAATWIVVLTVGLLRRHLDAAETAPASRRPGARHTPPDRPAHRAGPVDARHDETGND